MIDEELKKLSHDIPNVNNSEEFKNKIYNNAKVSTPNFHKFKLSYICFALIIPLVIITITIIVIKNNNEQNNVPPIDDTNQIIQAERKEKYNDNKKNYYQEYLESINKDFKDEYYLYQIEKNNNLDTETKDYYYEVTIDYRDGRAPIKEIVKHGEYLYPDVFPRAGYYFFGWYINGVKLGGAYQVYSDLTVYAVWGKTYEIEIAGCKYTYVASDDEVIITKGITENEVLNIPSTINDKKVIGIEPLAFKFSGLNLTEIIFPENIEFIGGSAFSDSTKMKRVVLPSTLNNLATTAFFAEEIEEFIISDDNENYKVINNCIVDVRTKTLVKAGKTDILPDVIEVIEGFAFCSYRNMVTVNIPEGVTKIKDSAFYGSKLLETIKFPSTLEIIDPLAFNECYKLKEVNLPKSIKKVSSSAFGLCKSLESINVEENDIYYSEYGCLIEKATQTLVVGGSNKNISKNVLIIGEYAYEGRSSLTEIIIPNNVVEMNSACFIYCDQLEKVTLSSSLEIIPSFCFSDCTKLTKIVIPDGVIEIYAEAFERCINLEEVVLPESLKRISSAVFRRCESLKEIDLKNVEIIEYSAFENSGISKVLIGDSLDEIHTEAFSRCQNLKVIYLPASINKIEENAFYYSSKLIIIYETNSFNEKPGFSSTTKPEDESIWNINWETNWYSDCPIYAVSSGIIEKDGLIYTYANGGLKLIVNTNDDKEITIHDEINGFKVTEVGTGVFRHNYNLEKVNFPAYLRKVNDEAFYVAKNLQEIILPNTLEEIGVNAFSHTNISKMIIPNNLLLIDEAAFSACRNLEEIIFNNINNIEIKNYAFQGCGFKTLNLPDSVTIIGDEAFSFCEELTDVRLPDTLEIIEDGLFSLCHNLSNIYIGASTVTINEYAFKSCKKLERLYLPDNVQKMHYHAITDCENLKELIINGNMPYFTLSTNSGNRYNDEFTIYVKDTKENSIFPYEALIRYGHTIYFKDEWELIDNKIVLKEVPNEEDSN